MKILKSAISYQLSAIRNEKGIALVMVLILSLISLVTMSGLMYMVTSGTQVSGVEKRYSTALEAGRSGRDIASLVFSARGNPYNAGEAALIDFSITASATCLEDKLNKATSDWDPSCQSSLTIDPGSAGTYDMTFQLGNDPTFAVYSKIVDTVEGNSGADEGLIKTGVVSSYPGEVTVMKVSYLYTMEIDAENINNPTERAKLSVLYQY
ncbi:MAG: hypothetical protein C4581_13770 [Nitrospiraceae bacterium]|nr:MAG: hypothetical protein C4581_13770 [Nitrospiraceae bacterium]